MKPNQHRLRAKQIIVEIVRQYGGELQNKTNLYKAFWRAHLAYAESNPDYLSHWPIVRMPNGPGIDHFDELLSEMLADHWITISDKEVGHRTAMVFALTDRSPEHDLSPEAIEAIRAGVKEVKGKTATAVSDESHRDSYVWNHAKDGDELEIYLDLIPDEERESRQQSLLKLAEAFGSEAQ